MNNVTIKPRLLKETKFLEFKVIIMYNTILVSKAYQLIVIIYEASTHHLGFNIRNEKSFKIIWKKTIFDRAISFDASIELLLRKPVQKNAVSKRQN